MTRYLITSALPYINGVKHLGTLAGSLLPADVFARFLRQEKEDVLFICATDEHGTPAELSALEAGLDVQAYCDKMHAIQADIYRRFGLSFDHFGRSSSLANRELTQHFYRKLQEQGYIESRAIEQVYSRADGRFLPDRYVVGTCPKCGYEAARGDQCENCTALLEPTDLLNPSSTLSGSSDLEVRSTNHLFFKLDALSVSVRNWVKSRQNWPRLTSSIAYKWLDEGLQERCITRDLKWGVPVPAKAFEEKVFYVWFDAPVEYIGATKEWALQNPAARDWQSWWCDATDVVYSQFMAKDNVPFHTVFWPAMVLGSREAWTMATQIKSFNWLTYYGGKFSTSQKRGVFLDAALDIRPPDEWRYFLLAQSPESDDVSFTWAQFANVINKDLVGNFGNFVNRTLKLTQSQFGNQVPAGGRTTDVEARLQADCLSILTEYSNHLRQTNFRKAIQALRSLWSLGNVYLDARAPWTLVKTDKETAAMVLRAAINLIRIFAAAAYPVIPFTSEKIFDALHLTDAERQAACHEVCDLAAIGADRHFVVPDHLFKRVEDADVAKYKECFGE